MTKTEDNSETNPAKTTEDAPVVKFETRKIYLKDVSFETPSAPEIFLQKTAPPKIDVEIQIDYKPLDEAKGIAEVLLKLTVTSKLEDNTIYLAEVHQAGIFQIQHPDPNMHQIAVEINCPTILLPFAREELNNLITKGGFRSFLITPVNFELLYRNKKEREMEKTANTSAPDTVN